MDDFGGGAVVISRRNADWFSTATFIETAAKIESERLKLKADNEVDIDLNDVVHDVASIIASDANNDGLGPQLDFLFAHRSNPPEQLLRPTA